MENVRDSIALQRAQSVRSAKSLVFAAAGMSCAMSVYLFFSGDSTKAIFVGLWVPSILSAANLVMSGGER